MDHLGHGMLVKNTDCRAPFQATHIETVVGLQGVSVPIGTSSDSEHTNG